MNAKTKTDAIRALIPTATDETLEVLAEVGMNVTSINITGIEDTHG